ncbi:hypothetical protein KSP40_PGU005451 [Platanthera guangdongensis]|uniref:Anticodon-binding domain-containing protein n=1 Tax=Platanthera guangdongensis TaxID=2320717 RepID=A0ABR2MLL6_9ASPA
MSMSRPSLQLTHRQFKHCELRDSGLSMILGTYYSVGWTFYDWERKDVPLRIEIKLECITENQIEIRVIVHGDNSSLVPEVQIIDLGLSTVVGTYYSVGWKFYDWERKCVPLRIEIKLECIAENQVQIVRRDNGLKEDVPTKNLVEHVRDLLSDIHKTMFNAAEEKIERCL